MKKLTKILSLTLIFALALAVGAAASIYFARAATMRTFHGCIEQPKDKDAHLVLYVDEPVGDTADIVDGDVTFPVLGLAHPVGDSIGSWEDDTGKRSVDAPTFSVYAEDGDAGDVFYRIEATGSGAEALYFGTLVNVYSPDGEQLTSGYEVHLPLPHQQNSEAIVSIPSEIGELPEGSWAEVTVSAWADADTLANLDDEVALDDPIDISVVFSATNIEE